MDTNHPRHKTHPSWTDRQRYSWRQPFGQPTVGGGQSLPAPAPAVTDALTLPTFSAV
jgi:hypothetical protein